MMTLEGRQLPEEAPKGMHLPPGKCVFCGKDETHINDGGNAWVAGAFLHGKIEYFLYCNANCGDPADKNHLWRCGPCSVDNVSPTCHGCKRPRAEVDADLDDDDDSPLYEEEEVNLGIATSAAPGEPCWNCCDSPVPGVFVHEPDAEHLGLRGIAERCNICCVFPDHLSAFNAHRRHLGQTEFDAYPFALFDRHVQAPTQQPFYLDCDYVVSLANEAPAGGSLVRLWDLANGLLGELEEVMGADQKTQDEIDAAIVGRVLVNCDAPKSLG
jgi:hypothetical protein